jgi:hypothetical protein
MRRGGDVPGPAGWGAAAYVIGRRRWVTALARWQPPLDSAATSSTMPAGTPSPPESPQLTLYWIMRYTSSTPFRNVARSPLGIDIHQSLGTDVAIPCWGVVAT